MQLIATFHSLLYLFQDAFTKPTSATFVTLATGWCLSPRHRWASVGFAGSEALFPVSATPAESAMQGQAPRGADFAGKQGRC